VSAELVSLREFARRKGWNPGYAHKLKAAGRLVMVATPGGNKVDVQASERRLVESADPARAHLVRQQPAAPAAGIDADLEDDGPPVPPQAAQPISANATFNKARTASVIFDAKLKELEYRKASGAVIDAALAARLAFTAFRALRDQVLNLPARLAPGLAVETDAFRIEQVLETELSAVFGQFDEARLLRETSDEDDDDGAD